MSRSSTGAGVEPPLFRQIVDHLRADIVEGRLIEHGALPSERVVAENHGVSRMTARRALEAVEAEGLAYSEHRRGRFVSPRRLNYNVSSMANFIADAEADGMVLEIRVIEACEVKAGIRLAKLLDVEAQERLLKCTRLFLNQSHPIFLETEYVVAERRPGVPGTEMETDRYMRSSPLGHSNDTVIRMRAIDPDEAGHLGTSPHQQGLQQEQISRDEAGVAFCFTQQIWRGELAQFTAKAVVNQ